MRHLRFPAVVIATIAMLAACGGASQSEDGDSPSPRRSGNRLSQAEMLESTATNVLQAIEQLRPMWLRTRGTDPSGSSQTMPVVYIDGIRAGELEMLRSIQIEEVDRLRYVNPRDATTRWGTGVAGGVIEVFRRRG